MSSLNSQLLFTVWSMPPERERRGEGRGEELVIAPATTAARGESISREGGEERGGDGVLVARLVACFAHR